MSRSLLLAMALTITSLALFACSDDNTTPPADRGPETSRDGPPPDAVDAAIDAPTDSTADAFVAKHEHVVQYGSGVPALRIGAITGGVDVRVEPPAAQLPVQVRKVALIPYGVFKYRVSIRTWDGSGAPTRLARKEQTVAAADVGKWAEVDFSADNIVVDGPFYVQVEIADPLSATATGAFSFSSSGQTVSLNTQGFLTTVRSELDILARVTYAAAGGDAPEAKVDDGASCTHAGECKSGYCVSGACTVACPSSGSCTNGRRCVTLATGDKICLPDCSSGQSCPNGGICLTRVMTKRDTFVEDFDPAGICVRPGPLALGKDCKDASDPLCQSGNCSACTAADCDIAGTCQAASSSADAGGDAAASDAGSGG